MSETPTLTEAAFMAACEKVMRYDVVREKVMIVSRFQHITFEVAGRKESWIVVRKPWKLRLRSARHALTWLDEYETRRSYKWSDALRELRVNTHSVLTDEARREIQWRHAEIRSVSHFTFGAGA